MSVDFMSTLKGALMEAVHAGGPSYAIAVCREKAAQIAQSYSKATGWIVRRTSLKIRNKANAPNDWERAVPEWFEGRSAGGEDVQVMEHWEVVEHRGRKAFRYMKVIPKGGLCLTCHGAEVAPGVDETLRRLYPEDAARGFRVGDIRGALTIVQPLE